MPVTPWPPVFLGVPGTAILELDPLAVLIARASSAASLADLYKKD